MPGAPRAAPENSAPLYPFFAWPRLLRLSVWPAARTRWRAVSQVLFEGLRRCGGAFREDRGCAGELDSPAPCRFVPGARRVPLRRSRRVLRWGFALKISTVPLD